jgi:pantoate--beta-alanine ligase
VAVSIFVNPTQFGPQEDFAKYPRVLGKDLALLRPLGRLAVFAPSVDEVYPAGFATGVKVGGSLGSVLDAEHRPGHFEGVATVVARFFGMVRPDRAYFGLKDYQQFLVIRRMARDLDLPVEVVGLPTVREKDGLALSSRNAYLSPQERAKAPALREALRLAQAALRRGRRPADAERAGLSHLRRDRAWKPQYLRVVDAETLEKPHPDTRRLAILAAARLGGTRLIDNLLVK